MPHRRRRPDARPRRIVRLVRQPACCNLRSGVRRQVATMRPIPTMRSAAPPSIHAQPARAVVRGVAPRADRPARPAMLRYQCACHSATRRRNRTRRRPPTTNAAPSRATAMYAVIDLLPSRRHPHRMILSASHPRVMAVSVGRGAFHRGAQKRLRRIPPTVCSRLATVWGSREWPAIHVSSCGEMCAANSHMYR